jgi:hypothetical protein
LLSFN